MKEKSIFYILLMLVFFSATLSVVSASENITESTSEILGVEEDIIFEDDVLTIPMQENEELNDEKILSATAENDEVLSAGEGSFNELQLLINSKSGTINLDKNYRYQPGDVKTGIVISKSIIINGNNYTIDGMNQAKIFKINSNGVTLKDLNIVNGYSENDAYGGAITWAGHNGIIENSRFISNKVNDYGGGAVNWIGKNGIIRNTTFINNTAAYGGALFVHQMQPNTNFHGYNLTFINNTAYIGGGAVISGSGSKISKSTFINNLAYYGGGAVVEQAMDGTTSIDNCIIVNNTAYGYGGGANINYGSISNSIVENNSATYGGGIYVMQGSVTNVKSINNIAVYGPNMAVISSLNIVQSYITQIYYFNAIQYVTINSGSGNGNTFNTVVGTVYCDEKYSINPQGGYVTQSVDMVRNVLTGENVGEYIKILIYEDFTTNLGDSIHTFVEEDFRKSSNPNIQHVVSLYDSGFRVPTINATKVLPDGTVKIYNFYTIINANCYQNCFYYKVITIGKTNLVPDLTVRKITLNKTVQVGEQTSFTIVVENTGNVDLNRVTVTEQSYDGLTFNSASTNGLWIHSIVNGKNVWTFNPTLKQGMTASFNVTFDTTKPGNFTNVVVAKSDKTDNKTTNNTTEVIDNPKLTPDIEVSKITLTPVVLVGQQTSFEIIVKNTGEVVLTKVFLEETSYDGLVYDSFVDNGIWTHSVINGKNVWTLNKNLDLNGTASLFVYFNTTVRGNFTNVVVAGSNQTVNKTTNNTTEVLRPDLEVTKISLTPEVYVGEQTLFLITVINTGEVDLNNVFVVESFPDGLIYDSFTGDNWSNNGNVFYYDKVLGVGESVNFTIAFNTTINGTFVNCVVAGSNETENKTTNNTTKVLRPDLEVTKISLTPEVYVGEQTLFLITVINTGEVDLNNVFVVESFPDGLIYDSFTGDNWHNQGNVFYYDKVLGVGESVNFTIAFNTTINGTFVNCVVAGSNETENKTTNNTTKVLKPGLDVSKITLTPVVLVGEQVRFEIVVRNIGETVLNNVFVEEYSYDGLVYDSFVDNGIWTHSVINGKNVWTLNKNLDLNGAASLFVNFNTTVRGNFTNVVVSGSDKTENKTTNNTTEVLRPDMEVTKVSLTPEVYVGEQTFFLITVTNTGDVDLTGVFVEETFPDGLIYDSFIGDNWSNNGNVFYYDKVLGVGESVNFTIAFNTTINGTFVNCVVAGSNETENKTTNNTTKVSKPGLEVSKITLTPVVLVGDQVRFEIVVRNIGETVLNNVFVEEYSYDGLVYDSFVDNGLWTHSLINGRNVWTLNRNLDSKELVNLFVNFNTTMRGNFTNVVVAGSDKTENKTANNTTTVLTPDLTVEKVALTPVVKIGDQVRFEIIVRNTGESVLTNVFVEESSYDGLTYDSYIDNGLWTHSLINGKNVWTLNSDLALNEVVGFFVNFKTTKEGNFTNVVVAGSKETENKTDNDTVEVLTPNISVQKITLTPIVHVGNQTSFEIIVKNTGKVVLTNVFLEETSYDGLTYDSFVDNGAWTHSIVNGKNVWTLNSDLGIREIAVLTVRFNTTVVGNFTNIVTVGSTETENKIANNTTIVYNNTVPEKEEEPTKNPDIDIEKIALNDVVILGSQVRFEIIVRNTGNVILNNVVVSEDSFEGLTYDSFIDYTGLWTKNGDLSWKLNGPLYTGEIAAFYVVFNTTAVGEFTNIVSVDSDETGNKTANDTVEVIKPDFAVEKIAINKSVLVGDQVMFEIVVHNFGQVTLNDVVVREESFEGLTYDSFIDYTGLWTKNNDLSWSLNTPLYVGEYAGFFVVFNTTSAGEFMNVIVADSKEIPNKTANDTVEVLTPGLSVQKITINRTVYVGEQVLFEIIVQNTGKVVLNNVVVSEDSFDGLTYNSFIDYNKLWIKNNDLSWTLNAPLYAGEYLSFYVVFDTTKAGNFTNIVSASSDKTDKVSANNVTEVIEKPLPKEEPKTPEPPKTPETPKTPEPPVENPVTPEVVPEKNETAPPDVPEQPKKEADVLPATGNPLIMVLLALVALGGAALRRRK